MPSSRCPHPPLPQANLRLALMLTVGAVVASALMVPASWSMTAIASFGVQPERRVAVVLGTAVGRLVPCVAAAFVGAFLGARLSDATHRMRWTRAGFIWATSFAFVLAGTALGIGLLLRAQLPSLPSDYVFPPVWQGLALLLGAAYIEELIFRFGLLTLCVLLVGWMMPRASQRRLASWIGVGIASLVFAALHLMPLGLLVDVTLPSLLGAFAVVMIAGIGLGVLLIRHGLHFAILSHALANTSIYLIIRFGILPR